MVHCPPRPSHRRPRDPCRCPSRGRSSPWWIAASRDSSISEASRRWIDRWRRGERTSCCSILGRGSRFRNGSPRFRRNRRAGSSPARGRTAVELSRLGCDSAIHFVSLENWECVRWSMIFENSFQQFSVFLMILEF